MHIIPSYHSKHNDLPIKLKISFEAVFEYLEKIAGEPNNYLYNAANQILEEYKAYPELRDGFEDFSYLETYNEQIDRLLDLLFPELLQHNEIKALSIPFEFTTFKLSNRMQAIIDAAGDDYELKLRNFDEGNLYIMTCVFIMASCYDFNIDFKRPFFFDIPDINKGVVKHYRTMFNGDFFNVKPLENAPKITQEDVKLLMDNFNNIDIWKEKFPPHSYEFKGFGIVNLFDVSADESLSDIKEKLLKRSDQAFDQLEESISNLFGSPSIKFGFSTYKTSNGKFVSYRNHSNRSSFLMQGENDFKCDGFFCDGIISKVFNDGELVAISDLERYGEVTQSNGLYKALQKHGIQSLIMVPLTLNDDMIGVMELVSQKKYELNSINAYKLNDVVPVFKIAAQRYMEEFKNKLESTIQENYTSLHPTVKWKFYEEARGHLFKTTTETPSGSLDDIIFEEVTPLYGQSDIKGSSIARNKAIQTDLIKQLSLASAIIEKAEKSYKLPIYKDLLFRIESCLTDIKMGLNSGDEVSLTDFLRKEIYPVFNHLKTKNAHFEKEVAHYMKQIDGKLHVVYDERKKYEDSVNTLNEELAKYIDTKQVEVQQMFPHYFERYKTDGIDYNMYIGQSLVEHEQYDPVYLYNLRLWQLQLTCEMEHIAHGLKDQLSHPLEIASLILVHSNPLAIKFRMDEKRFDVDGAYNIRYEIIKKRIDKALIKNTEERLTVPGKIAIVYSQEKDAREYLKYIKYLQSTGSLLETVDYLDLEDLQGISGLKAIRVAVNYSNQTTNKISIDDIMDVIKGESLN